MRSLATAGGTTCPSGPTGPHARRNRRELTSAFEERAAHQPTRPSMAQYAAGALRVTGLRGNIALGILGQPTSFGRKLKRGRVHRRDWRTLLPCGGPDRDRVCSEALYMPHLLHAKNAKKNVQIKTCFDHVFVCDSFVELVSFEATEPNLCMICQNSIIHPCVDASACDMSWSSPCLG